MAEQAEWPNGPEPHAFRPEPESPTVCAECGAWQGDSEHAAEYYREAPHYPTSAELAAMRRDVALSLDAWPLPRTGGTYPAGHHHPSMGGAWPHEREHGIGYRSDVSRADYRYPAVAYSDSNGYRIARREANRMRRAAFAAGEHSSFMAEAEQVFAPWMIAEQEDGRTEYRSALDGPFLPGTRPESETELRYAYGDR